MTPPQHSRDPLPSDWPAPPFPRSWWVASGTLLGGCYPGDSDPSKVDGKLTALLDAGVRTVICLQGSDERGRDGRPFAPYLPRLQALAGARGVTVTWARHAIPDMGVPTVETMAAILAAIAGAEGVVFVHCWGGHGRTGTVAGCWLRAQGMPADAVLSRLTDLRTHDSHLAKNPCPQTAAQVAMVRFWPSTGVSAAKPATAKPAPKMPSPASSQRHPRDRARGALIGLAVGDALGTTLEFTRPAPQPWSTPLPGPHGAITGGGPFRLMPGQVTDDTQMACCLANYLTTIPDNPLFDIVALARSYGEWSTHAFDIGNQTRSALQAFAKHANPEQAGIDAWVASGRAAAGNGSLMRTAAIGALNAFEGTRLRLSVADSRITHADPRCVLACASFNEAVARGIGGGDKLAMLLAARSALTITGIGSDGIDTGDPCHPERITSAVADLTADLDAALLADPWLNDERNPPESWPSAMRKTASDDLGRWRLSLTGSMSGFVRVAYRLAFWQLMHAESFAAGLLDTVNRGGDADTNGAIVGALLGARFGESGMPSAWVATVSACDPPAPWHRQGSYHPAILLEALERSWPADG